MWVIYYVPGLTLYKKINTSKSFFQGALVEMYGAARARSLGIIYFRGKITHSSDTKVQVKNHSRNVTAEGIRLNDT